MMTHSLNAEDFAALGAPDLVYVRPVKAEDILAAASPEALRSAQITPYLILYAVHGADGARLAVMADKDSAYAAALANELAPVSVH